MDEPLDNASILMARPNAVMLVLCSPLRVPLMKVEWPRFDKRITKPIFYRKRSLGLTPNAQTRLDYTVFGYGAMEVAERGVKVDTKLWAWNGILFSNAPAHVIDQTAIDHLLFDSL